MRAAEWEYLPTSIKGVSVARPGKERDYYTTILHGPAQIAPIAEALQAARPDYTHTGWGGMLTPERRRMLLRDGDPEMLKRVKQLARPILDHIASRIIQTEHVYSPSEGQLDVAEALSGNPDCFIREQSEEQISRNVVHVTVTVEAHGHVTADQHERVGACIIGTLMALEAAGRSVTLDIVTGSRPAHITRFPVKADHYALNLPSLCYLISNRESVFAQAVAGMLQAAPYGYAMPGGAGSAWPCPDQERGDIHMATNTLGGESIADPEAYIREQLALVGVKIKGAEA